MPLFPARLRFLSFDVSDERTKQAAKYQQESQLGPSILGSRVPEIYKDRNFPDKENLLPDSIPIRLLWVGPASGLSSAPLTPANTPGTLSTPANGDMTLLTPQGQQTLCPFP